MFLHFLVEVYILLIHHRNVDNQMFPVSSADSEFIFRNSINTPPDDYKLNDTVYHTQRFYSHFSYDDGSPESIWN